MKTVNFFKGLIFGLIAILNPIMAYTQTYEWFENYGASTITWGDKGNGITSETMEGESYSWTVGRLQGSTTIGAFSLTQGAFIAAFDADGNCVAAKNIQSTIGTYLPTNSEANGIASYFVEGNISVPDKSYLFVTGNYSAGGIPKIFVTKFECYVSMGVLYLEQYLDSYIAKGGDECLGRAIDVCPDGVYITGRFTNQLLCYYGAGESGAIQTLNDDAGGNFEAFVLRLALSNLHRLGVMATNSTICAEGMGISAKSITKVSITGYYKGDISFRKPIKTVSYIDLATSLEFDVFIAKPLFASLGGSPISGFNWAKRAYSNSTELIDDPDACEAGRDVEMDAGGNYVYLTGKTAGTLATFGALSFSSSFQGDAFVAKYSMSDGTEQWVTNLNTDYTDYKSIGQGIDLSGEYLYVCGHQFWAKLSTSGVISSVNLMEPYGVIEGGSEGRSISVNTSDALYYTGVISDGTIIGPPMQTIDCVGTWDVFTAKIYDADILRNAQTENLFTESDVVLSFYPAIITDHAIISLKSKIVGETICNINIYNETGSLVENINKVDLTNYTYNCNLDPGFYIYEIKNLQGSVFTGKFVKQ